MSSIYTMTPFCHTILISLKENEEKEDHYINSTDNIIVYGDDFTALKQFTYAN